MQVIGSVLMASLGEYICSRNELEDIPLYSNKSNNSNNSNNISQIMTL